MKMRKVILLSSLFAFAATLAFKMVSSPDNIALFFVVKNNVEKKQTSDWIKAKKADLIYPGDFVRTQKESFALIKFNDASTLRLGPNSEVQIYGDKDPSSTDVRGGDVGFSMTKRKTGLFEFTTPTSVASIRGTQGMLTVQVGGTDLLSILEGLVWFRNIFSNDSVEVSAGQTGVSSRDGNINVHNSTHQDSSRVTQLDNQFNQQKHKLEMWFKGSDGKLHEIIIETQQ